MTWLSSIFRSKSPSFDPSTFEKELSQLSKRISILEKSIASLSYTQRRIRLKILIYGFALYFFSMAYLITLYGVKSLEIWEYSAVLICPGLIILLRSVVFKVYQYRIKNTEIKVENLRQEHSSKIEELKELANFQTTKNLLARFNNGEDLEEKLDNEIESKRLELIQLETQAELLQSQLNNNGKDNNNTKKNWMGSIIDMVTDEDEFKPMNRYALICVNCLNHNGLAPPGLEPVYVKYVCPRCGQLNGCDKNFTVMRGDTAESDDNLSTDVNKVEKKEEKEEVDVDGSRANELKTDQSTKKDT